MSAAVHTDAAAIFGSMLVNEAEDKVQFVKFRPTVPFDSKSPITFSIPGNSSQYVSLRDSYLYIECHIEDAVPATPRTQGRSRTGRSIAEEESDQGDDRPSRKRKRRDADDDDDDDDDYADAADDNDEEAGGSDAKRGKRDTEQEGGNVRPNGTTTPTRQPTTPRVRTYAEIAALLDEAADRYRRSIRAWEEVERHRNHPIRLEQARTNAQGLEDMASMAIRQYLQAKEGHRRVEGLDGALVPVDNVLHSLWNGVDVSMNQELVSTTNQKYMYKAFIETVLNNSASTKRYQLKNAGYYGDTANKDTDFNLSYNRGMEERYHKFRAGNKVELMGFLQSDIMGIQASIVNGVEINITLTPNLDSIRLQGFGSKIRGNMIIDKIILYVCKRQMSKEVVVAHADIMESAEAVYPYKRSEVRAYNGHRGQSEVIVENPYQSNIPTRFIVAMIDAAAYMGNPGLNPLNFQHFNISRAAFYIDDESIAKPPYHLDPSKEHLMEPLMELYSILGKMGEDKDIGISMDEFMDGLFMLPFDVTPLSSANMELLAKREGGNCRLELQFHHPLPRDIIILTYAIFPMELLIDGARNCKVRPI